MYKSGNVTLEYKKNHNRKCDCGKVSATLYILKIHNTQLIVCPTCLWLLSRVLEQRDRTYPDI